MTEYQNITHDKVSIKEGFWSKRQALIADVTISSIENRFEETGRFKAFQCDWHEGEPMKPHIFWDSDIAKWIESVALISEYKKMPQAEALVDKIVDLIEKNRHEDGYFNIYYTVVEPGKRFTNRDNHELYCAGHLIEAAIAYYKATGKDKLLRLMCDYVDLIEKIFVTEKSAAFTTPGHEELELALIKLYRLTGEQRYLQLSEFFIDNRGKEPEFPETHWSGPEYSQSHIPVREQSTAEGHAVRACYLYSAMADLAAELEDYELYSACLKIFDDIYYKKMYITGGIGSSRVGEAFTKPYDLPASTAYAETCAAIALAFFASRLQRLKRNHRFGDAIERVLYNGMLSGLSLDGKAFFYENPLEINFQERDRHISVPKQNECFPITRRKEVFDCSCCPPNLTRFIASIGDMIYYYNDDEIIIDQFISSTAELNQGGETVKIAQKTAYPYEGRVELVIKNAKGKKLYIRIPPMSQDSYQVLADSGKVADGLKDGYVEISIKGDLLTVVLELNVKPRAVFAAPYVFAESGKCSIMAGPLVYCAEGCDNPPLTTLRLPRDFSYVSEYDSELDTQVLIIKGFRAVDSGEPFNLNLQYEPCDIRLIPYFAFANREESDMQVRFALA